MILLSQMSFIYSLLNISIRILTVQINKMKIANFFIIFLSIFLLISTFDTKFTHTTSNDHDTLLKSFCKITNDATNFKADTQDIIVGNMGGKIWSSTTNDIIECIDKRAAVVVTNFGTSIAEKRLRKASIIILMLNKPSEVKSFILNLK